MLNPQKHVQNTEEIGENTYIKYTGDTKKVVTGHF